MMERGLVASSSDEGGLWSRFVRTMGRDMLSERVRRVGAEVCGATNWRRAEQPPETQRKGNRVVWNRGQGLGWRSVSEEPAGPLRLCLLFG